MWFFKADSEHKVNGCSSCQFGESRKIKIFLKEWPLPAVSNFVVPLLFAYLIKNRPFSIRAWGHFPDSEPAIGGQDSRVGKYIALPPVTRKRAHDTVGIESPFIFG